MIYYFYKIVCDDLPDYVYVGSTRAFTNRKYQHKSACNNENCKDYNVKIYQTIRANGGWNNFKMICIHQQDVENKRMAEKIEEDFRLDLKANMNAKRAFTTEEDKKEDKKEYNKEWYENNKEKIKEKSKLFYENNKEQCKEYAKEYRKEYNENNKEKIKEHKKNYYENNKEKIKQHVSEKITCECGCQIRRSDIAEHKRTQKHIKLMENM